jgi:KilA-N domain/Zinc finger, C2H2 type
MMSIEESKEWTIKEFAGYKIRQRNDGKYRAGDMCAVGGKMWKNYYQNKQTKEFLDELESVAGIPATELIQTIQGGDPKKQGTWVHPRVAIHLAQWISAKFAVQVTDWVLRFMSGDLSLVREVVQRHDEINNTESKVCIDTMSRELIEAKTQNQEYVQQIQVFKSLNSNLENQVKRLTDETKKMVDETKRLHSLRCPYCTKMYSSPNGLTTHIRKHCDDNHRRQFRAIVDFDKFKSWCKFVVGDWKNISEEYEFNYILTAQKWETDEPKIKLKSDDKKSKNIMFDVTLNDSRWQFLELINKKISVPLKLLLESNSLQMFNENKHTFEVYIDAVTENAELLKYKELHNLLHKDEVEDEDED